jgi:hypothetical protein
MTSPPDSQVRGGSASLRPVVQLSAAPNVESLEPRRTRSHLGAVVAVAHGGTWMWVAGLAVLGVVTHLGWFGGGVLTASDWGYESAESLRALFEAPQAWDGTRAFGRPNETLSGVPYQLLMGGLGALGAPYALAERLVFFFPFAVLPLLGMFWLAGKFTSSHLGRAAAAAVYGLNTYILVIGTNQLTIAMAYAVAPFAIAAFLDALDRRRLWKAVGAGFALAVATAYDPRIGYLVAGALLVLAVAAAAATRAVLRPLTTLGVALGTMIGLHLYWVLPVTVGGLSSSVTGLLPDEPFISFANLTHALALNHPFWTGGAPAVFVVQEPLLPLLALPLLAGSAFLLPHVRRDWALVAFGALALVGVFLVKGENAPFGSAYGWAFDYAPGFRLFRDMSKFNLYVALGYAVLIGVFTGWAAAKIGTVFRTRSGAGRASTLLAAPALLLLVLGLGFSAWPALTQRLGGTLESRDVPEGYRRLEQHLRADDRFGRVLWLPAATRFTTQTDRHPALQASDVVERVEPGLSGAVRRNVLAEVLGRSDFADAARSLGIRYVAVDRVPDPSAWDAAGAPTASAGRSTVRAWLNGDPGVAHLLSTRELDVYRIRGRVGYAELTAPFAYSSSGERDPVSPEFATVERGARRESLQRVRGSTGPAGGVVALPAEEAWITEDALVSRPFRIDRSATFRIRWRDSRPARGEKLTVLSKTGGIVWSGAAAATERLTLAGPATYRLLIGSRSIDANLIPDGSFERSVWGPVGDAHNYDNSTLAETGISVRPSYEARTGRRSLRLDARRHVAGVSSPLLKISSGRTAVLRFSWRSVAGPPPGYAPYLGRDVVTRRITLSGSPGWNEHSAVFDIGPRAEGLAVSFYAGPGDAGEEETAAVFDDVDVAVVPRWLRELRLEPVAAENRIPIATSGDLRRMSISIAKPGTYMLRVSSNFDAGWSARFRLRLRDGWASEPPAEHVRTIDGTNAWILRVPEAPARVEASLSYAPQRWVTAGAAASVSVLLALVAAFVYVRRKHP